MKKRGPIFPNTSLALVQLFTEHQEPRFRVRLVPSHQLLLQRCNGRFGVLELSCQHLQHLPCHIGQPQVAGIANNRDQLRVRWSC